jgi:hypothetical protein
LLDTISIQLAGIEYNYYDIFQFVTMTIKLRTAQNFKNCKTFKLENFQLMENMMNVKHDEGYDVTEIHV